MDANVLSRSVRADTACMLFSDKIRMLPQRTGCLFKAACACCLLLLPASAPAFNVEIRVSNQVSATADFRPGKPDKPALLLLHGFLQTRDFGIMKSLLDELASAGYTVLAPNLSLGISYRKNSLSCEALHLHDMEGDLKEIQLWVQWLLARGHKRLVGIGHSFGATQLLAWKDSHRASDFELIGISLVSSAPLVTGTSKKNPARPKLQDGLMQAPLSFCESYTAPAGKYASYYKWNDNKVLSAIKSSDGDPNIILGSQDKYLPPNWQKLLSKAGARVHLIKDANHFMEGTQEFDMFDITLDILKQ